MKRASTDPTPYNENIKVCLVERNDCPGNVALVNSAKVGKKSANDLVSLVMEIEKADTFIRANVTNRLQVIVDQVQFLKQKAHAILQEAEKDTALHQVACNFHKVAGSIYHLYERPSGQKYFSMLSPEEWSSPHQYHGSYRLNADQSWTELSEIKEKDFNMHTIENFMQCNNPLFLSGPSEMEF